MPRSRIYKDWRIDDLTASGMISTGGIYCEDGTFTTGDTNLTLDGEITTVNDVTFQQDLTIDGNLYNNGLVIPRQLYDSVASMVADTGLVLNQIVATTDYFTDYTTSELPARGGNYYQIVAAATGTHDGGSFIDLDNGLQAKGLFPNGVNVMQFGVKYAAEAGDGDKLQAAIDYVYRSAGSNFGGTVTVPSGVSIQVDTDDIDIHPNVTLAGEYSQTYTDNAAVDDWTKIGALVCDNVSFTVDILTGACLRDIVVMRRSGIDYAGNPTGLPAAEVANFTGTGTVVRASGGYIKNVTYLGFDRAIDCTASELNLVVENVNIDCRRGFRCSGTGIRLVNVKCLPFLSENTGDQADRVRSGIGFELKIGTTNVQLLQCSTIQDDGVVATDVTDLLIDSCWITHPDDGTDTYLTGDGISLQNGSGDRTIVKDTIIENHQFGLFQQISTGNGTIVNNCVIRNILSPGPSGQLLRPDNGDLIINGGNYGPSFNNTGRCIQAGTDVNLRICGAAAFSETFHVITNVPGATSFIAAPTVLFRARATDNGLSALPDIAPVGAINTSRVLPACSNVYTISDGTNGLYGIDSAGLVPHGRIITIYFQATTDVVRFSNNPDTIFLNDSSSTTTQQFTIDSSLRLLYQDSVGWFEVSRGII